MNPSPADQLRCSLSHQDLEAQQPPAPATDAAQARAEASSAPAYARAGRGGAGNFYDQETAAEAIRKEKHEADKTKEVVESNLTAKPRAGLSGRGGAGNWADSSAARAAEAREEERKKAQEVDDKVMQAVEAGLAMPPPIHHQRDRETDE